MRTIHLDQYEFDTTGSEKELELVIGTTDQFRDLAAFVHRSGLCLREGPPISEMTTHPLSGLSRYQWVGYYLQRFAGLELPDEGRVVVLSLSKIQEAGRFDFRHFGEERCDEAIQEMTALA